MIHLRRLAALQFKQLDRVDLELPERARILVKGLNEAGKSTLFEAVFFGLFGQPLGGQGARSLDDLIRYGADSAQVDLTVGLSGGRALEIRRQLRRGKPNIWELDLLRADGGLEEQIRGNREVNLRVAAELGFDAESLLNTCFVEQKKLDKLEGMNRAEREQSLMKLLNLDHLLAVAERLKVRLTDRQALARLTDRRDLARYQEELPRAGTRVGELEADLARLDALGALDAARTQLLGLRAADAELALAREAEAALTAQAAQAQALAEALAALEQARQAARQAAEAAAVAARARELAERCRLARDEELPAVMARGLALRRLARRRDWLNRGAERAEALRQAVARRDAELDVLATDLGALNQTRRDLVEARAAAREAHDAMGGLEQDRRAFEVRAALGEWLAAGEREAVDDGAALAVEGVREERRRLEARQAGLRWGLLAAMAAAAIGLAIGLAGGRAGLPRGAGDGADRWRAADPRHPEPGAGAGAAARWSPGPAAGPAGRRGGGPRAGRRPAAGRGRGGRGALAGGPGRTSSQPGSWSDGHGGDRGPSGGPGSGGRAGPADRHADAPDPGAGGDGAAGRSGGRVACGHDGP